MKMLKMWLAGRLIALAWRLLWPIHGHYYSSHQYQGNQLYHMAFRHGNYVIAEVFSGEVRS